MTFVREALARSLFLRCRQALYVAAAAIVSSPAANAVGFSSDSDEFFGSWDTILSYGMGWRLDKPGSDLIGTVNGGTPPLTIVDGYRRMDVSQFQATAMTLSGPVFGATPGAFLFEGAVTHAHRMPAKGVLRFNGPATYVSGNAAVAGIGHPGKPFIGSQHFADAISYRSGWPVFSTTTASSGP